MWLALLLASSAAEVEVEGSFAVKVVDQINPDACDRKLQMGDFVTVKYVATIDAESKSGTANEVFDRAVERPLSFQVGSEGIIAGLSQGIVGMCNGTKAIMVIPPELAFGERTHRFLISDVPGNATVRYNLEVVNISDEEPPQHNLFDVIDKDGDMMLSAVEIGLYFKEAGRKKMPAGIWDLDKDNDRKISYEVSS